MQENVTHEIIATLYSVPPVSATDGVTAIFLKNSLASLTVTFLGLSLCFVELQVYKKVSSKTYDFLESLTSPMYKLLGRLYSTFKEIKPFFRSCLFYLLFVPYFAILVNGLVFGILFGYYFRNGMLVLYLISILPHAALEIPAMFASAFVALSVLDGLRVAIINADLGLLEAGMKKIIGRNILLTVFLVQVTLLLAAILEVM